MRQPTARTWAILEAAHRLAQAEGTTTEMVLAMVAEDQESRGAASGADQRPGHPAERAGNTGGTLVRLCAPQDASISRSVPIR